jgi:hypothetical protein
MCVFVYVAYWECLFDVTLRWDIPVVCYKYHKNEAESQSEHSW